MKTAGAHLPELLPIFPLRTFSISPKSTVPLMLDSADEIAVAEHHASSGDAVGIVMLRDDAADPMPEHLYAVGTSAKIAQILALDGGQVSAQVTGIERFRVLEWTTRTRPFIARVEPFVDAPGVNEAKEKSLGEALAALLVEKRLVFSWIFETGIVPRDVADMATIQLPPGQAQQLLESTNLELRLERLLEWVPRLVDGDF